MGPIGPMVKIAIDASSANKDQKTGVEWYAYHVIERLKRQALSEGEEVFLLMGFDGVDLFGFYDSDFDFNFSLDN